MILPISTAGSSVHESLKELSSKKDLSNITINGIKYSKEVHLHAMNYCNKILSDSLPSGVKFHEP